MKKKGRNAVAVSDHIDSLLVEIVTVKESNNELTTTKVGIVAELILKEYKKVCKQ